MLNKHLNFSFSLIPYFFSLTKGGLNEQYLLHISLPSYI